MSVPVIDLTGFVGGSTTRRRAIADDVDRACRDVGFFSVVGHGVDEQIIADAHEVALAFFDLPLADRLTAEKPNPSYPYGYSPFSKEALNRSLGGVAVPDLKETYNVGPVGTPPRPLDQMVDPDERDVWSPTMWPVGQPRLRASMETYYAAMADLATTVMDAFALALGLGSGWFAPLIDQHGSALRLAHYPPLDAAPTAGAFRAGAHTDYGTLTILRLDAEPGLQVERSNGEWVDVDAPDGALVVNLGDLMQRWSNDRWRSTMHRVIVPEGRHAQRRLTMPFFHNANWDALVECIVADDEPAHYEPVGAGAHLMEKFRATVV
jgi:isopenicillin N synthase-like dioxygenase